MIAVASAVRFVQYRLLVLMVEKMSGDAGYPGPVYERRA